MSKTAIITRQFQFDMGHRVPNHASKCANFHGHRYVALVELEAPLVDTAGASDEGMVMDFADVKRILGTWIDDNWDHGFMLYSGDKFAPLMKATGTKVILVPFIPTAENLAAELLRVARELVGPIVTAVTIYETPNCTAEVRAWN